MSNIISININNNPEKLIEFNKKMYSHYSEVPDINLMFLKENEWYKVTDIGLLFFHKYVGHLINEKLVELGYQYEVRIKGKPHWFPTEKGISYTKCYSVKYDTTTNTEISYRIKWHKSIIPILRKAFFQ